MYGNQNLIRETFISELNKTIHLVGAITFFDVIPKNGKVNLINSKNKLKFDVVKNNEIASFNFSISHTNAKKKIDFKKKERNNSTIVATEKLTRLGHKRKMSEVVETVLVKALQSYDRYTVLNPLQINLSSNYLNQKINDFKGFAHEVLLKNILFRESISNDTQNVFITCSNLNSAKKKTLTNGKIYNLLGIINLNEIKNWDKIKAKSIYVNAKVDDSHYMENAKHIGFKFKTTFPTEVLEFTCELLDDNADQIKFSSEETKVHILDLQIDIVK